MGPVSEKHNIVPFAGKDFGTWKYRVKLVLDDYDVLDCVEEDPPEVTAEWKKRDKKAKLIIAQFISDSHLEYIKEKGTSKLMWDTLIVSFERKGVANQNYLRRKLLTMKLEEGQSMETFFLQFDDIIRQLKSSGAVVENADVVSYLLMMLPPSYDSLTTALETLPADRLTLDVVKSRLMDEELKKRHRDSPSCSTDTKELTAFAGKHLQKFKYKCYGCGKIGHKKENCWKLKKNHAHNAEREVQKREQKRDEEVKQKKISFITSALNSTTCEGNTEIVWILDSGATDHLINDRSQFDVSKELIEPVIISVAKSGEHIKGLEIGNIQAVSLVGNTSIPIEIKNVLFVPNLRNNLLSVRRLEMAGVHVNFANGKAKLFKGEKLVGEAIRKDCLYEIVFINGKRMTNIASKNKEKDLCNLWHRRMGHLSIKNVLRLQNMVNGIPSFHEDMEFCEICVKGKQTRRPFNGGTKIRSRRPLEQIHSDICGPISPITWDRNRYFVSFIDDYTHFTMIHLIKKKSELLECFKKYEAMVTAQFGHKIIKLRSDQGAEYMSNNFKDFCRQKGIQLTPTMRYTPQQNGVAERMNRTLVEKARSMLLEANLSKNMWGEAVLTATYLTNRSPTQVLEKETPAEMWFLQKPNISKIRVFGCKAYVHIPQEKRKKFDAKSEENVMVGYAPNGYRLWNFRTKKVILSRDVIFVENKYKEDRHENYDTQHTKDQQVRYIEMDSNMNRSVEAEINNLQQQDGIDDIENKEAIQNRRQRRQPIWMKDYANMAFLVEDMTPNDYSEIKDSPDRTMWKKAISEEIDSHNKNNTWTIVDQPGGIKPIGCKWIFKIKQNENGDIIKYKARLVAKGFMQKHGIDYQETYAPVAKLTSIRIVLAVANQMNLNLHQMDVKTAFLNGYLQEDIYMTTPEGIDEHGKVCKLNKSLYGLKQSPRCWNTRFNDFILSLGFNRSRSDYCLYIYKGCETMFILLYVDDVLIVGNETEIKSIKEKLSEEFEMTDMGELKYFLGLHINRDMKNGILRINQKRCIENILKRFNMEECKGIATPIETNLKLLKGNGLLRTEKPFRELIGCLMYVMLGTRPDICLAVGFFSRFQETAEEEHWVCLKRVLRYLKHTINYELVFNKTENVKPIFGFVDADWGSDPNDRKSISGYLFKVYGCTISWTSKKQQTVSLSSTEAEYIAACSAACEVLWLKNILLDMNITINTPINIFEDNQGCIQIAKNPDTKRTKHIDIKHHFIREQINEGVINLVYIPTNDQLADVLTKGLPRVSFEKFRTGIGILII